MEMVRVVSDNVHSVGYDPSARRLRVAFRSGGIYDYLSVDQSVYFALLQPHPWRRYGKVVLRHPYVRVKRA